MDRTLVLACGALASELISIVEANLLTHVDVTCLPASWHMTPDRIPEGVQRKIRENRAAYQHIVCLYGDCGTGGRLDDVLDEEGVTRIGGDHCYAFYAGVENFAAWHDKEPGTYYLTDFLVRHFEEFVIRPLGLDQYPELLPDYFGNFSRVLYLSQTRDSELERAARAAAARLELRFEIADTGLKNVHNFLTGQIPIKAIRG